MEAHVAFPEVNLPPRYDVHVDAERARHAHSSAPGEGRELRRLLLPAHVGIEHDQDRRPGRLCEVDEFLRDLRPQAVLLGVERVKLPLRRRREEQVRVHVVPPGHHDRVRGHVQGARRAEPHAPLHPGLPLGCVADDEVGGLRGVVVLDEQYLPLPCQRAVGLALSEGPVGGVEGPSALLGGVSTLLARAGLLAGAGVDDAPEPCERLQGGEFVPEPGAVRPIGMVVDNAVVQPRMRRVGVVAPVTHQGAALAVEDEGPLVEVPVLGEWAVAEKHVGLAVAGECAAEDHAHGREALAAPLRSAARQALVLQQRPVVRQAGAASADAPVTHLALLVPHPLHFLREGGVHLLPELRRPGVQGGGLAVVRVAHAGCQPPAAAVGVSRRGDPGPVAQRLFYLGVVYKVGIARVAGRDGERDDGAERGAHVVRRLDPAAVRSGPGVEFQPYLLVGAVKPPPCVRVRRDQAR